MADTAKWYVVHTYSGYENTVKATIEKTVESRQLQDRILDGPLSSFTGTVESIEVDKNAVNVIVSMFGRETSVEFELDMIEVVSQ